MFATEKYYQQKLADLNDLIAEVKRVHYWYADAHGTKNCIACKVPYPCETRKVVDKYDI